MLIRSFARVGIIVLVDEATGYQEVRDLVPARPTMRTDPITVWKAYPLPGSDGKGKKPDTLLENCLIDRKRLCAHPKRWMLSAGPPSLEDIMWDRGLHMRRSLGHVRVTSPLYVFSHSLTE